MGLGKGESSVAPSSLVISPGPSLSGLLFFLVCFPLEVEGGVGVWAEDFFLLRPEVGGGLSGDTGEGASEGGVVVCGGSFFLFRLGGVSVDLVAGVFVLEPEEGVAEDAGVSVELLLDLEVIFFVFEAEGDAEGFPSSTNITTFKIWGQTSKVLERYLRSYTFLITHI